jgi:hypothetical protein
MSLQYQEISDKIESLESKYDEQFAEVYTAMRYLLDPKTQKKEIKRIGYK